MRRSNRVFPSLPSFFDDFWTRDLLGLADTNDVAYGSSLPAVNISETNDEFEVDVAAPGFRKDDFKIELDNNVLSISSEVEEKQEDKDKEGNFRRREFRYASFSRSFTLPEGQVNTEKIKAEYVDGVLKVHLPKAETAKTKPVRTINIG
jgi:HSP20 family protein